MTELLQEFELLVAIAISIASLVALLTTDWRISIAVTAVQFFGVFTLIVPGWSLLLAIIILIAGWLSGAILGMAVISLPRPIESPTRSNPFFNFLSALLVFLLIITFSPLLNTLLSNLSFAKSLAALTLIAFGLLRLSLDSNPLSTIAAILAVIAGFDVIFAALTKAQFAVGASAAITLLISLAGAYLLIAPAMESMD